MKTFAYTLAVLLVSAGYIAAGVTINASRDDAANAEERAKEAREAFETASARAADSEALLRDARADLATQKDLLVSERCRWEASERYLEQALLALGAEATALRYDVADAVRLWLRSDADKRAAYCELSQCDPRPGPREDSCSVHVMPELAAGMGFLHPARPGDPNDERPEVRP